MSLADDAMINAIYAMFYANCPTPIGVISSHSYWDARVISMGMALDDMEGPRWKRESSAYVKTQKSVLEVFGNRHQRP